MTNISFTWCNSLRNRILLLFLVLTCIILIVTLQSVNNATYKHSTKLLDNNFQTSLSVINDKLNNRSNALLSGIQTLVKDFSIKQLYARRTEDIESLRSALDNQQSRLKTDIYFVLDKDKQLVIESHQVNLSPINIRESFVSSNASWLNIEDELYLLKASPIKFVESSQRVNGWVLMGIKASRLFNPELLTLTNMHVSLVMHEPTKQSFTSTLSKEQVSELKSLNLDLDGRMHDFVLEGNTYIYSSFLVDKWANANLHMLFANLEDEAYLSYKNLLLQLFVVLAVAASLALIAAIFVANTITKPIAELESAAKEIQQGEFVESFPENSTNEVNNLSDAIRDMQLDIVKREEKIQKLAYYNELTGLPNRVLFTEHLSSAIEKQHDFTVMMMDIDRFKEINETLGHQTGDQLLCLIADRLQNFVCKQAFFAHMGGDEFAMIVENESGRTTQMLAESMVTIFEQPFVIDGLSLDVSLSTGIAVFPEHADNPQLLMQAADIALYACKETFSQYTIYQPELNKYSVQRLNLMSELKEALVDGQLEVYFQPKLSLASDTIDSAECLIRWIHPIHGFVSPDDFIPLAEQTGAIKHVTKWVLREAIGKHKEMAKLGFNVSMAVNISAIDLDDMSLPHYVSNLLTEFKVAPSCLVIEVTESAIMNDPEAAINALNTLSHMGIKLSIDDFGTGYSSMVQLKQMPVNELKIDKAFVLELSRNEDDKVMVKTMVSLAQNLGLETVAEGVEDQEALAYLKQIGCTKGQGFHMSKPLPNKELGPWLSNFYQKE